MPASVQSDDITGIENEIGQIARGAGVGLGGNVIYYAVSYLFGILVARQIGAENFGLYTLGVTAVTLASLITVAGLDRGLMRYASISRGEGQGSALRYLTVMALAIGGALSLVMALVFWFFPQFVLSLLHWTDKEELLILLPVFAIAIPTMTMTGIAIAGTQAFRTMRYRALVTNVIQPLVKLGVAVLLIFSFGMDLMAPVLGFVIAQVVGAFLSLFFLARLARSAPKHVEAHPGLERKLLSFSAPLLLTNVVAYLNGRTELFVLGIFLTADVVGVFNAAMRLAGLGLIVLTAFNAIFSPVISDLHNRGELERLSTLFKLVTRWMLAAALPIFLVQMLFAPQIMSLFGPEFASGAHALQVLSVGQMINIATGGVGVMLIMSGRSQIAFINSVVTVIVALALDFWLVPRYGLMGAAVAGAIVISLVNLVRLGEVWVLMHVHPFSRPFLKPLVAILPGLAVGLVWRQWLPLDSFIYLVLACFAVGGAYLLALLLLGLDRGDRVMIEALRVRLVKR